MTREIDRDNIRPGFIDTKSVREQASVFLKARPLLDEIRKAYLKNLITKQQLLTLRGQVLNGDSDGAVKGLARLLRR